MTNEAIGLSPRPTVLRPAAVAALIAGAALVVKVAAILASNNTTVYVLDEVPIAMGVIWVIIGAQLLRRER